jgi:hypothetical protein
MTRIVTVRGEAGNSCEYFYFWAFGPVFSWGPHWGSLGLQISSAGFGSWVWVTQELGSKAMAKSAPSGVFF